MGVSNMESTAKQLGALTGIPIDILCELVLPSLSVKDVICLSCTSKAMSVICLEEPLWMLLCLANVKGSLTFKGSWRATAIADSAGDRASLPLFGPPIPVPGFFSEYLYRRWCRCHMDVQSFFPDQETITRVDGRALTREAFAAAFLHAHQPVMLLDLQSDWAAGTAWQVSFLRERFSDKQFEITAPCGRVFMTMNAYLDFSARQYDEDPLYLFDSRFGSKVPEMLQEYVVPTIFPHDLFEAMGQMLDSKNVPFKLTDITSGASGERRPPFRWFVMGPARSGASWHIDPLCTSAWNSLVSGLKRWALYPPDRKPPGVHVWVDEKNDVQWDGPSSLTWFLEVYPTLSAEERPLEIVQRPGETIFVPGGWWHMVLNLESSIAVTQNFASGESIERVVRCLAYGSASEVSDNPQVAHPGDSRQGFLRNRILAPFLHQLAASPQPEVLQESTPHRALTAQKLAEKYAAQKTWLSLLERAVSATGIEASVNKAELPIAGGSCVVFKLSDYICKFVAKGSEAGAERAWAESLASACLLHHPRQLTRCSPRVHALGSVDPGILDTAGLGVERAMPFVAMTACSGTPLDVAAAALSAESWLRIAAELGRLTAQLHPLPLPEGALFGGGSAGAPFTLWQSRAGLDLSFRPAGAETGSGQALLEHLGLQQSVDSIDATTCVILNSSTENRGPLTDGVNAAVDTRLDRDSALRLWRPFLEFLRERRRSAPGELAWEHSLPRRLLDQLEQYLPPDPAAFLPINVQTSDTSGCSVRLSVHTEGSNCAVEGSDQSWPVPSWLHGDLIAQNILVSEACTGGASPAKQASEGGLARDAVQLIDFGDAGHGDPLYDLVLLLVEALRCEQPLWEACLSAAVRELEERPWWLYERAGLPLSHVAMTYVLLHEQDLASALFKAMPDLWRLHSLQEIELAVFGQLNHL